MNNERTILKIVEALEHKKKQKSRFRVDSTAFRANVDYSSY